MASIFKEMDEKYGNCMEKLFGPGLLTWPEDVDSSRMYMFTANLKQWLVLLKPDVPHVMTGYENIIGKYNKAYKKMEGDWEIVDIIWKYGPGTIYTMILYNKDTDTYDIIEKKIAENLTEKFGYLYDTSKMDSLSVGDKIKDAVLYKSTSYDDNMNYRFGKNARVMYVTDNSTIEDSIVISKKWAEKVKTVEVDTVEVSINLNDILINLYGDNNTYKTFPDIGEVVNDSIVCGVRRINFDHILYDFKESNLRIPQETDMLKYASKNSLIYDIDVFYNGEDEFPDNIFYKQLSIYYKSGYEYAKNITEWCKRIKSSGSNYTDDISYFKSRFQKVINKEQRWKNRDSVFSNIVVRFHTVAIVSLQEGFKLTGRYGDKGIISKISGLQTSDTSSTVAHTLFDNTIRSITENHDLTSEDIEKISSNVILADESDMPYLEDGTRVDILLNSSGSIRRLNTGQIVEVEINFIAENIQRKLKEMNNIDEKAELVFKFLSMLNKDEERFFFNIFKSFDKEIKIGKNTIKLMDTKSKELFIKDIEDNGFYIVKRPDAKIRYDAICALYEEFPWIKPYDAYIDRFGIKKRKLVNPVICANKYMLVLKQTSNKNFSARSTGRIDKKGLPAKSSEKKQNLSAHSRTPIRIGETHNLFSSLTGRDIAEFNIFMRSSPIGRKSLKRILESDGDPFDITKLSIEEDYTNTNAMILNAMMKSIGIRLNFDIFENCDVIYEDLPTEYTINGYIIFDLLSRKPIYRKLLDRFINMMESIEVIETYIGEKEDYIWKKIFDEIKKDDQIDEFMKSMLIRVTSPVKNIPSKYEEKSDDKNEVIEDNNEEDELMEVE